MDALLADLVALFVAQGVPLADARSLALSTALLEARAQGLGIDAVLGEGTRAEVVRRLHGAVWCDVCGCGHAAHPVGAELDRHRIAMWNKPLEVVRG